MICIFNLYWAGTHLTHIQIASGLGDAVEDDDQLVLIKVVVGHDDVVQPPNVTVEHLVQVVGEREAEVEVGGPAGPSHLEAWYTLMSVLVSR